MASARCSKRQALPLARPLLARLSKRSCMTLARTQTWTWTGTGTDRTGTETLELLLAAGTFFTNMALFGLLHADTDMQTRMFYSDRRCSTNGHVGVEQAQAQAH